MINLDLNKQALANNIKQAKENNVIIPTFKQMKDPEANVQDKIKAKLADVGLWDINPLNLFRVTWKNEPKDSGGKYSALPNFIELPKKLTGVDARIICMVGKYFPTGCHKVGPSVGCLVPRLVTGQFDATKQKAVWPSTGNYCRGGAFNSKLLAVKGVAILPEGMSRERFDWLRTIADEVIATPGTESNVKEIFDKVHELRATRGSEVMIFNQFEEMGNYLWHFNTTGNAIETAYESIKTPKSRLAGVCLTSGSAGTLASADYLKTKYPGVLLAVGEALQCPTILDNGFGAHRIEGIGDKHIPWVHNVKTSDMAIAIDDNDAMALLRLFNDPAGKEYLEKEIGMSKDEISVLSLMGISGIANMLMTIKMAKYYELTADDVVATVLTDSGVMYESRLEELDEEEGKYNTAKAGADYSRCLAGQGTDNMLELTYAERKRVHNLKYYTWVEQQGRTVDELNAQWYDQEDAFVSVQRQADEIDELINAFNEEAGVLKSL
ncbi:pyridoxal-5-phosphate-dependent protein subunit beta [Ruminococcaceae bacterium OttesenSCG-928-A11]|nr:pyridoxal-5-phosphate-dependent protein subunit beta [Ruminococcaceae bacterium OttesenSCG-928-A11]